MSNIRKKLSNEKLSDGVITLLMKSWSSGTCNQYSPHINRWMIFCVENKVDPVTADVRMGAEFLTQYFYQTTVDYSSLNTARSALSTIIEPTNGVTFGNHPLIKILLKGIFKERPTLPRYTVTYDVNKVFLYMKSLPPVCELNLETITKCLATLLCLLTGQRSQTLAALSLQYMHRG